MMMLFAYYVFLFGFQISGDFLSLYGVIAGLTFYNSSVIAELIRSGVGALPTGPARGRPGHRADPVPDPADGACCRRPSR